MRGRSVFFLMQGAAYFKVGRHFYKWWHLFWRGGAWIEGKMGVSMFLCACLMVEATATKAICRRKRASTPLRELHTIRLGRPYYFLEGRAFLQIGGRQQYMKDVLTVEGHFWWEAPFSSSHPHFLLVGGVLIQQRMHVLQWATFWQRHGSCVSNGGEFQMQGHFEIRDDYP